MGSSKKCEAKRLVGIEGDIRLYGQYPDAFCCFCGENHKKCGIENKPFDCSYWEEFWKEHEELAGNVQGAR